MEWFQFLSELFKIIIFSPVEGTKGDVYIHVLSFFTGSILGIPKLFYIDALIWFSFVLFIPHWFYTLSNMIQFTSVFMLGMPFLGWIFPNSNLSIRDFLGTLF